MIHPDDSIDEAQAKLLKQNTPGSPVIDQEENPVGFLSERDCLVRIMKIKYHNDMSSRVQDVMSPECIALEKNGNIMTAVEAFSDKSSNIMPVVNSKNKVVGVLTRHAVFRYVLSLKQQNW